MYSNSVHKQSVFSRSLANEQKMGAYYTDIGMCKRIGSLFSFPEKEECCVLEPAIGDGMAVLTVTGKDKEGKGNIKIFGVELNPETLDSLRENASIDYSLHADFLDGVRISHNAFSFCFANPPYGKEESSGKRLEALFCEKLWNYLTGKGILALIIPHYVLKEEGFLKSFFPRFSPISVFRFDDAVFRQFQQVVVIASKRPTAGYFTQAYHDFYESISALETLPYLPAEEPKNKIAVHPSKAGNVECFTTLAFDTAEAGRHMADSPLFSLLSSRMFIPSFVATELGHPPMPLKKDLLYLTAIAGGGQGLVGSEENHDLHLQRGVAKVVTSNEVTEEKGKAIISETSFTEITLSIIENDGRITVLK